MGFRADRSWGLRFRVSGFWGSRTPGLGFKGLVL